MNRIKELQNEPKNLNLLAAQRVLYAQAKHFFGIQIFITVFLSVVLSFIKLIPMKIDLNSFVVLASIIISFIDLLVLSPYISKIKTNAAKCQEAFDCNIYELEWNATNSGDKPAKHIIQESIEKYIPDQRAPIEDWYDIEIEHLSRENAVLLCQETNLFYDGKLREEFKNANVWCCVIIFVISVIITLLADFKVGDLITKVIAPLLPLIILTIKIVIENGKSLKSSAELKQIVSEIKTHKPAPTVHDLRRIQDKIYCSRKDSALVPEWFYKLKRARLEKAMKANAIKE